MGSRRAGLVASALLAVAGFHIQYSQEARAYAILTFLVAVVVLAVVHLVTEPVAKDAPPIRDRSRTLKRVGARGRRSITWTDLAWPAYGVAMGLALHMHNTSITIPLAANIGVGVWWVRSRPKPQGFARNWVLSNLLGLLIWLPWIPGFIYQVGWVGDSFWAQAPSLDMILRDVATLGDASVNRILPIFGGTWVDVVVVLGVLGLVGAGVRTMDRVYRPTILSFIFVLPVVELILTLRRPVFLGRTLLWILVGTLVAIGFAVSRLRGWQALGVTAALMAIPILGTVGYHVGFEKTPWDEAAAMVAEEARPDDAVLVVHASNTVPFRRYFDPYGVEVPRVGIPRDLPNRTTEGTELSASDFEIISNLVQGRSGAWLLLNREVLVQNSEDIDPLLRSLFTEADVRQLQDLVVIRYSN
jgi:hypothetical protein